jgi:hypothetical protein
MRMISLGDKVRDVVTGFEGIVIARTDWLNGCVRFVVQPDKIEKNGKQPEGVSIDEQQLEVLEAGKIKLRAHLEERAAPKTGGPMPEPRRQSEPGRR